MPCSFCTWCGRRALAVGRWLDVGLTIPWGDGQRTVSQYAAEARNGGVWWGRGFCRVLDWFAPGHCDMSLE
jgi:hypothetical protein